MAAAAVGTDMHAFLFDPEIYSMDVIQIEA
jgi:hypothetical protein